MNIPISLSGGTSQESWGPKTAGTSLPGSGLLPPRGGRCASRPPGDIWRPREPGARGCGPEAVQRCPMRKRRSKAGTDAEHRADTTQPAPRYHQTEIKDTPESSLALSPWRPRSGQGLRLREAVKPSRAPSTAHAQDPLLWAGCRGCGRLLVALLGFI